ncbi:Spo0E family sporulation regulatory protein-aspartic acid phosphatase [Virgibacillus sp. W0430]|uniref:Spo0E family sporulation regulatory protein-aspartic acid phosphatase n=1 Tax=Virgibacillus sp. W0430 TaxID=3391580 RepID=UPI003F460BB7
MGSNDLILKQIEILRNQMTEIAFTKGFTSEESIEVSQRLDQLLNLYSRMNVKAKAKSS